MSTRIAIEVNEKTLRKLVLEHLRALVGAHLAEEDVKIEVKSKQNYRSDWEPAEFRAKIEVSK